MVPAAAGGMSSEAMAAKFVYVTTDKRDEALAIARTVVEERLAACANLLGPIESVYWWDGAVQQGNEVAFILKTDEALLGALIQRIEELHSYECPCIVALPIEGGHEPFLKWIQSETSRCSN